MRVPFLDPFLGAVVPEVPLTEAQAVDEGEADHGIVVPEAVVVVGLGLLFGEVEHAGGEAAAGVRLNPENDSFGSGLDAGPGERERVVAEDDV